MTTFAEEVTLSELKSLRRHINGDFNGGAETPAAPILLTRRENTPRPYWRIMPGGPSMFRRAAAGWNDATRQYVVGYFGDDYESVLRTTDTLRRSLQEGSRVQFTLFDTAWFPPLVLQRDPEPLADALVAGAGYNVSCSVVTANGDESLASAPLTFDLDGPTVVEVRVPRWPEWAPVATPPDGRVRVYLAGDLNTPRRLVAEAVADEHAWTSVVLTSLPDPAASLEPTTSEVAYGSLTVEQVSINAYETPDVDGEFDGIATVYITRAIPTPDLRGWGVYDAEDVLVTPLNTF
jgi:hypothetical protein